MKKLASLVLALIMVFSVAGTAACAENAPVEIEFFTSRSFEGAAGILIMSAVRCVDDNQIQPFQSDKFLKTPHNTSVGILLPGEFLTALHDGSQFKMRIGGDEGSMKNTSRHSVSG